MALTYGVRATLSWDVPADSELEAIAAAPVQRGSTHPKDGSLVAEEPEAVTNGGPRNWIVRATYVPRGELPPPTDDPYRPQLQWYRNVTREQVSEDAEHRPITNSALDSFDPPPERDFGDRGFSIFRHEATYDLALAENYEDTVNDSTIVLLGKYRFTEGQLRLESYLPTTRYAFDAELIEVEYRFAFRRDGWDWRILDQGRNGFYPIEGGAAKAAFVSEDGSTFSTDVLLDGRGSPVSLSDEAIRVGKGKHEPIPAPKSAAAKELEVTALGVFLIYPRYPRKPFSGLQL